MSTAEKAKPNPWLVCAAPRPDAAVQLLCLPYAGGGASVYRSWPKALAQLDIEVRAIELPGRGRRTGEPPRLDVTDLVNSVAPSIDRPYAVFGHSLGARLGFELCRGLRERGLPEPVRLYVSGSPSPRLPRVGVGDSKLPDEEFVRRVLGMGGTPAELLAHPELLQLFLPVIRSDFEWGDTYEYHPMPLLTCPITAFAGANDPEAPPDLMATWSAETTGEFRLQVLPGGHFYLDDELDCIVGEFSADLSGGRDDDR